MTTCTGKIKNKIGIEDRTSGVLLHVTSLPSPYGIGDLGPDAKKFIDFLVEAGQRYWQILPLGPVNEVFGCSPYMSLSAFAGNPLLISPDLMVEDGLLTAKELEGLVDFSEYVVNFTGVIQSKTSLIRKAFFRLAGSGLEHAFRDFCQDESSWLLDYALFMTIREHDNGKPWSQWPDSLRHRDSEALLDIQKIYADTVSYYQFEQFVFFRQWFQLRSYAHDNGVLIIGDLPIYVGLDSVDVWANQSCFELDAKTCLPIHVAGVPPDYFSETGQRWGNPLYRWKSGGSDNEALYAWWRCRFRQMSRMVDSVRIDHFRGFEAFWQIPAEEETAVNGRWVKGPGRRFFKKMSDDIAGMPIIAEDLGIITPEVIKLRDALGLPGMKILQFAFDSDSENLYLPHNFDTVNCVVFTGTHDNNTACGWYLEDASEETRARVRRYAHSKGTEVHWDLIRLAFSSVAVTALIPLQDILGFGGNCRMNMPGTAQGNWSWRCAARFMSPDVAKRLREETEFYGRKLKEVAG